LENSINKLQGMKISRALKLLIDASFVNGELSKKEKDVLVYRAVAEGLNQEEFEIYLDSLVYKSNSDKKGFLNKILYQRRAGYHKEELELGVSDTFAQVFSGEVKKKYQDVYKKKLIVRLWHVLFGLTFGLLLAFTTYFYFSEGPTVEEHLAKFNFEKARIVAGEKPCTERYWFDNRFRCQKTLDMLKIIAAESQFLIQNNEFKRAKSIILELNGLLFYDILLSKGAISKTKKQFKEELLIELIVSMHDAKADYNPYLKLLSVKSSTELNARLNVQ
tara:strand:- start:114 stop:941 length:828 start_codon:yes stop_codon:yes gene_type:complete